MFGILPCFCFLRSGILLWTFFYAAAPAFSGLGSLFMALIDGSLRNYGDRRVVHLVCGVCDTIMHGRDCSQKFVPSALNSQP